MMQCSHTRSLTVLRLYAAILSVIWSDYNGRYCMPTGLTMQANELESDLVAIQGQRHVRKRCAGGLWEADGIDLRCS